MPRGGMRGRGGFVPPGGAAGGSAFAAGVLCVATAKFKYAAQDDTELSLEVGELINITQKEEGWWTGYKTNPSDCRMMPCNYVGVVSE
jgi:SH3 domain